MKLNNEKTLLDTPISNRDNSKTLSNAVVESSITTPSNLFVNTSIPQEVASIQGKSSKNSEDHISLIQNSLINYLLCILNPGSYRGEPLNLEEIEEGVAGMGLFKHDGFCIKIDEYEYFRKQVNPRHQKLFVKIFEELANIRKGENVISFVHSDYTKDRGMSNISREKDNILKDLRLIYKMLVITYPKKIQFFDKDLKKYVEDDGYITTSIFEDIQLLPNKGIIIVVFKMEFIDILKDLYTLNIPKELFKIDERKYPSAFLLGYRICLQCRITKKKEVVFDVPTLLEYTNIPSFNEVKESNKFCGNYKRYIIEPFVNTLKVIQEITNNKISYKFKNPVNKITDLYKTQVICYVDDDYVIDIKNALEKRLITNKKENDRDKLNKRKADINKMYKNGLSIADLSKHFGISEKTVRRDLKTH